MNLETVLTEYGLKQTHTSIYLSALELGSAPVLQIARKCGMARSTCEAVLESLNRKGFVSSFKKKNVRYFTAEDPHRVIRNAKQKANLLEESLPQFMALYGQSTTKPSVRFYSGKLGMQIIMNEVLDEAKELLAISAAEEMFATLEPFTKFVQQRIARKIPIKVILKNTPKAAERKQLGVKELRQVKILPANFDYQSMMYLWKNKIAMLSFGNDLSALVIESKEISQMQKAMFYSLWETLN